LRSTTEGVPMETTSNTAAIYVRRSAADERDADDSDNRSHARQERDCQALAERHGLTVVEVYREKVGTSASRLKTNRRPQLERALDEVGTKYHTLLVWAVDRLTRKGMAEAGLMLDRIDDAGGRLISNCGLDTETQGDELELIFGIKASMARSETEKMAKRVRAGKEEQRLRHEYLGGSVPYGWLRNHGVPCGVSLDHDAVPVIVAMVDRLIEGATLAETCRWLTEKGHLTQNGARWTPSTLSRFVRSVHLVGHRRYGKSVATDADGNPVEACEPIISPAKFARVDKVITARRRSPADPSKPTRFRPKSPASLLGGLVKCCACGGGMSKETARGRTTNGTAARDYGYYSCRACHPGVTVRSELEDHVARQALLFVASLDPESAIADEVARRMLATFSPEQASRRSEIEDLLPVIQGRMAKFRKENLNGLLDDDEYQRLQDDATMKINALRDELATLPEVKGDMGILLDLTQASDDPDGDLVGPGSAWAAMEHHLQREILRVLVDEITIERRPKPSDDIVGRTTIEFATEDTVVYLANRPEKGKRYSTANKVALSA